MNKDGPIVIIDDDFDDQEIMQKLMAELGVVNDILFFDNGMEALEHLRHPDVKPFLVVSDINMPGMDGFELRTQILADPALAVKCIPYIFCTTGASAPVVSQAYSHSVQGIFQKPGSFEEWKDLLHAIIQYWQHGISPNRY